MSMLTIRDGPQREQAQRTLGAVLARLEEALQLAREREEAAPTVNRYAPYEVKHGSR
ncbi:MAG: hypothetical protein ACYDFS_08975 [Vulcanimicrobiaceae bacterium]